MRLDIFVRRGYTLPKLSLGLRPVFRLFNKVPVFVKGYRRGTSYIHPYTRRGRNLVVARKRSGIRVVSRKLRRGNVELRVFRKKELIGWTSTSRLNKKARRHINLREFKVVPSEQGKGVAKGLYKEMLRKSSPRGGLKKSDVVTHNAVHSIYKKIGSGNIIGRRRSRKRLLA